MCQHSHYRGLRRRREREGPEKIFEAVIPESFPNMRKEAPTEVQEAQRIPGRINPRSNTPRHILIKLTKIKDKEKILKATREKQQITYKGIPIRLSPDFPAETVQATRGAGGHDIFKVMKGKKLQSRILYRARLSFRFDGEIKSFTDRQKLRELSTTRSALQQMLKELL